MMKTLIILFLSLFSLTIHAQRRLGAHTGENKRYTSYGIAVNAFNYVGELDPGPGIISPSVRYTKPGISITATKRVRPFLSLRGALSYGRIQGDDYISASKNGKNQPRKIRNLNFKNDIFEAKGDFVLDFLAHHHTYQRRHSMVPYAFLGIAAFYHEPYGKVPEGFDQEGKWIKLRPLHTEGRKYAPVQVAVPFGFGIRYKLADHWDLAFEVGWRYTFTDYLDDVSSSYGDPLQMSEMGRLMAFKSAYITAKDPAYANLNLNTVNDPYGNAILLPGGVPLQIVDSYAGAYVYSEGSHGTQKVWKSDILRGDKNKDWYIVSGIHLTYIPPIPDRCPKNRNHD